MDEVKIWALEDSGVVELERAEKTQTEKTLEDTLVDNPGLLEAGLTLVGRQTPTQGGPLDLLGVDEDGKLVVFELKRGTLSRDAVAQVIDYTSDLTARGLEGLTSHIAARSGQHGIQKIDDLEEWFLNRFPERDPASLLPPRMVLVGLGSDDTTSRMVKFLFNTGVDISLLTFQGFSFNGQTLLAKQVEVGATASGGDGVTGNTRRSSATENRRVFAERAEAQGASELVSSVREMFKGCLHYRGEYASVVSKSRLNFNLPGGAPSFIDLDSEGKGIKLGFHPIAVGLALDEFNSLDPKEIPYEEQPSSNAYTEELKYEILFPLSSIEEWESRKDKLTALTEQVYAAYLANNDAS